MNCVAHQSPGLWTHPRDRTSEYNRLPYWIDLARTLERGRFDGLFLADVLGVYDVFGGSADAALRNATQTPANDPLLLISAMAAVTKDLGFGVTSNLSYEPPYTFARRMSTLDHLTEGRIGWNVVTGYLDSAARGAGKEKQTAHDDRYDVADEYMEVVYKLWEGSWEDDAALRDRARGIFADPAKVHRVQHEGNNYRVDAIHLCEPSPQRTPVLYQAGTSPRGRQFAAQHAECVFMSGPSAKIIAPRVAAIRELAAKAGRNPAEILMFSMFTIILGRTDAEAKAKYADYRSHINPEGALTLMSGWTGVDFSTYDLDQQVRHVENDAGRTAMDNITRADNARRHARRSHSLDPVRVRGREDLVGGTRRGSLAIRLVGLLVSVAAVWLVAHSVDLGACATVLSHANPIPLAACLGVIATQVVLRSVRWRLLLPSPPAGGRIGVSRIVPVLLVGYLGNAVLPARLGEPIRAYLVARREELDAVEAFGSVVLERVVDTATLAVVAFVAAVAVNAPSWIVQATGIAATNA